MAGKKTKGGGKSNYIPNAPKDKTFSPMLIRNKVSNEDFLKAYGKWNKAIYYK